MNMLSWNCQGLGHSRTVRDLHRMAKEKHPSFVFLIETLCSKSCLEWLRVMLGFVGLFVVDLVGRSGGLTIFWKEDCLLEIYNYSRRHINAIIKVGDGGVCWKFTGFHGHPVCAQRLESWALLKHLRTHLPLPWLCVGDFNEVVEQSDKEGGALRSESKMEGFRNALVDCHLSDLDFRGNPFTWSNHRHDDFFTEERLDRAVANPEWYSLFKEILIFYLAARASDHCPIQASFSKDIGSAGFSYNRGFKFEDSWTYDSECFEVISNAWTDGGMGCDPMKEIQCRLTSCQKALSRWSGRKFGNVPKEIKRKTVQL
jgi:exonuclease III